MSKKIIAFVDTEIEKCKFHYYKYPININNEDINKIIVSNKASFGKKGFKHFIGYRDDEKVKPSCIMLSKMREKKSNKAFFFDKR